MMDKAQELYNLRLAKVSDIPGVSEVGKRTFTATFGHTVTPEQLDEFLDESYSPDATAAVMKDPDRELWVAASSEDDNIILGFVLLTRNSTEPCISHLPDTVELQRIYVDASCHGKGVGTALALQTENLAKKQGFKHLWLGVWEENFKAQKFYERLGYQKVGTHDFSVGGDIQTDNVMVKAL